MSEVLYRKYRPQDFSEVIGQDTVKTILKNALQSGRVSHAYLFHGPRGVGKTTIARILAKALNCEKPKKAEPDRKCDNCVALEHGRFLDLIEIDAASYTGVDNIREVIEHVKFSPSKGKYKVFIIDEVHMLSKAAFNALLKTLEEPPEHAIFILATTEIFRVPPTIVSRTQRFDFTAVSQKDILSLFERILPEQDAEVAPEAQRLIAQAAGGSFRDGLSILDQVLSFGSKQISVDMVEDILGVARITVHQELLDSLIQKDAKASGQTVRDLASAGKDLVQFSKGFLEYLRLVLLFKMGIEDEQSLGLLPEEAEVLRRQAGELSGKELLTIIARVMEAYREAKTSPVQELPLLSAVFAVADAQPAAKTEPALEKKAPAAKPDAPKQTVKSGNKAELDLGQVVDNWSEVLSRVKEYNHSLISSLRLGRLVRMDAGHLVLAFPYSFHKETIEARKNKIVVEQVLEDVFERRIKIRSFLENELKDGGGQEAEAGEDLLTEAMKALGSKNE